MPIDTITHKDNVYPLFQSQGFAAKFAFPYAAEVCKGEGLDIGSSRPEWAFPGAHVVDPAICKEFHAMNLPKRDSGEGWDYFFSSHALEHISDWVRVLDYWHTQLKPSGVLFLFLPHFMQSYWRGWFNRKHQHVFTPEIVGAYFNDQPEMWRNVFVSGVDLNSSFMVMAEKV